jgi:hypothetical protein
VALSNRRAALRALASGTIGAAAAGAWVDSLSARAHQQAHAHAAQAAVPTQDWKPRVLSARQDETVTVLSELIIPQTGTPGARAARVNRFIDAVLREAPAVERDGFMRGLAWIDERSRALYKKDFAAATGDEQTALLTRLADDTNKDPADRPGVQFFRAIKSMTIDGYYTSEIGLRQELGDSGQLFLVEFPGCTHEEHR